MSNHGIQSGEKRRLIDSPQRTPKPAKLPKILSLKQAVVEKARACVSERKRKREEEEAATVIPEAKKVWFGSKPARQDPQTVGDVLHDLVREADAIARGACANPVLPLWSGLSARLLPVLAAPRSGEVDGASAALAVILLATSHAELEERALNGEAAGFRECLARIRDEMKACPPERSWQDADVEAVLRGIVRICMHAVPDDAIPVHALAMLGALCGRERMSSRLEAAMTSLVRAAGEAWFNLDRVRGMPGLVTKVIDELRKIEPPSDARHPSGAPTNV